MSQQTYFYYAHSLKYEIKVIKFTKRRIFRKNIETKYLYIGCQRYSEQTLEELAMSSDNIYHIDMGKAGILLGTQLRGIWQWFSKL